MITLRHYSFECVWEALGACQGAIAIALYGSNEYSYSVGDLLTAVCVLSVSHVSVFTFYALYSFLLQRVVDGGFSDNIPHAKDIDGVITVSHFPGDFDICPEEDRHHNMKHFFHIANMELQFNMHNWWRIKQCLISPSMSEMRDIQREGYRDTLRFLKARGE